MVMSSISDVTRATRRDKRNRPGEDAVPAVWRARVVYIRATAADCGTRSGVYITVPNLTRDEIHGPVQVVGDTPTEGDLVVAVAVEGRKNDWIIITPSGLAGLVKRLTDVEHQTAATQSQLDTLDTYVEHYITARMGAIEWDVEQLDARLTSTHGETVNAIGLLEAQMEILDAIVEAHQLGTITWWTGALPTEASNRTVSIPGYSPSGVARQGRVEVDVVLEGLRGFQEVWCRPVINGSPWSMPAQAIDPAGETHRFRYQWDIQVPANATVEVQYAVLGGDGNRGPGRIGVTRPVLSSVTERSA